MTERLFYNNNYEKRSTRSQVESKQKLSGPAALGGDTEEEGDYMGSTTLLRGCAVESLSWVYDTKIHLAGLKTSGTDNGAIRKLRLCL